MSKMRKIGTGLVLVAVVSAALVGAARDSDIYFLIKKNFTIFSEVYREVSLNYVDEVNPEKLMRKGINSMLESLDPYTVFIDEAQSQDLEIITRGSYGGVGLDVGVRGNKIVVIAPLEGYSAFQKGIRSGDIIKAVDGVSVDGISPEEVQELTVGEPGTAVTITINRYGLDQDLTFELKRQRIEVKNIAYSGLTGPDQNIGYILLNRFSQNAAEEIRKAISDLQSQKEIEGLVLDLRNNPGGLLEEAVRIVDKFVEPGLMVVETRGKLSEHNSVYKTQEPPMAGKLPLVVLQNGGSASASEIVAGALQDLDRGVIVGERSFGKGLVQIVRPLSYNTALKITTARYYIPSGRSIQSITYTHDENNTQVSKPDSLRKAFKTRNGRTVYDGEGIAPDLRVEGSHPTLLETALLQQSHFFFFANEYASENKEFEAGDMPEKVFTEFKKYLKKKNFSYETRTQQYLAQVEVNLADRTIEHEVKSHIRALKEAIEAEKEQEFDRQSKELKNILYLELISRYHGNAKQIEASLKFDPVMQKALDVLSQQRHYKDILAKK